MHEGDEADHLVIGLDAARRGEKHPEGLQQLMRVYPGHCRSMGAAITVTSPPSATEIENG